MQLLGGRAGGCGLRGVLLGLAQLRDGIRERREAGHQRGCREDGICGAIAQEPREPGCGTQLLPSRVRRGRRP